ncbi:MAG: hypothetical protein WD267_11360 [Balneolales bacterium]
MLKSLLLVFCMLYGTTTFGQVTFSMYSDDDIILSQLGSEELDFGMVLTNSSINQIELGDSDMVIIAIEGVEYYDVIVTIDAPTILELDSENSIPFELSAAYANRGQNQVSDAIYFNGTIARFPIKRRGDGPPSPPPVPGYNGYTPPTGTAYLFLYGNITVGEIDAGHYTGNVNITVEYD